MLVDLDRNLSFEAASGAIKELLCPVVTVGVQYRCRPRRSIVEEDIIVMVETKKEMISFSSAFAVAVEVLHTAKMTRRASSTSKQTSVAVHVNGFKVSQQLLKCKNHWHAIFTQTMMSLCRH